MSMTVCVFVCVCERTAVVCHMISANFVSVAVVAIIAVVVAIITVVVAIIVVVVSIA